MSSFDRDPVKELFDRERDQIVSHHGNDLHWQGIVHRARAQRRSRFLGYAAGMTAAGLVIVGVTYGAFLHNGTTLLPATSSSKSAISTPGPTATGEPTRGGSTAQSATPPVPVRLTAADVTKINDVGILLATTPGPIEVVKAKGSEVMAKLWPGVGLGSDTATTARDDLLVIRSDSNVPQGYYRPLPGHASPVIATAIVVVDAVNGNTVSTTYLPAGDTAWEQGLALLGTPIKMTLTSVTPRAPPS